MKNLNFWLFNLFIFGNSIGISVSINKLLIVSLDGFRYDYLQKYKVPNLKAIIQEGISCPEGMIPSFPTATFPNHHTLVTGLYPESHGIVYNTMYDPVFNESFDKGADPKWWSDAEPIWITAQTKNVTTAVSFWPGVTVKFNNKTANIFQQYVRKQDFVIRVDQVVNWFAENNVDFAVVYFEQPDGAGHRYGPNSPQVEYIVNVMDATVGYLKSRLEEKNLWQKMNVLIVSDHGMTNVIRDKDHIMILEDFLKEEDYITIAQRGPVGAIMPQEGKEDIVYEKLKDKHPHIKIYKKMDIPDRLHYKNHRRIMPIVAIADEHYVTAWYGTNYSAESIGDHGYDNQLQVMRAIFIARGPAFKKNVALQPFPNTNVYSLLCHLLNVDPLPSNGTLDSFHSVLVEFSSGTSLFVSWKLCSFLVLLVWILAF